MRFITYPNRVKVNKRPQSNLPIIRITLSPAANLHCDFKLNSHLFYVVRVYVVQVYVVQVYVVQVYVAVRFISFGLPLISHVAFEVIYK